MPRSTSVTDIAGGNSGKLSLSFTHRPRNHGGSRGTPKIIVLHSTEGHNRPGISDLRGLASFMDGDGTSVHAANDAEGNCARLCPDDFKAFHCASYNSAALGIEQIGFAAQNSWPDAQIDNTAKWVAYWAKKYNIPLKRSTSHGVCTHSDLGPSGGGHTDPGSAYPFNDVLSRASAYSGIEVEGDTGGDSGGGGSGSSIDVGDIMTAAKAATFVTELQFPGEAEVLEANALQGQRSMLNDKPLFDFIQQLTEACMRRFQSLPDGRFFAFYPDYFGSFDHRKPYWKIYDIEITEGGIDLTDDELATHVYVAGDTVYGGGVTSIERLVSTGTVTLFNYAHLGFKAAEDAPEEDNQPGNEERSDEVNRAEFEKSVYVNHVEDVIDFLTKYGARPLYHEAPMIRNPYFEAFMAYQKFQEQWSKQFLTTMAFTFMPEVYPGGLIAFPDQDLQCFVESVSHIFDYEGGFQTTANLTSPATLTGEKLSDDPLRHGLVRAGGV
jgi:hypothetical protein